MSTALGLDELPGHIPAHGRVLAPTARRVLDHARAGDTVVEWRLVLLDDHGHLEHVFLVRPGPPDLSPHQPPGRPLDRPPRPRRGNEQRRGRIRGRMIVELAAPTTMLAALDPTRHPTWAVLIRRARQRLGELPAEQHVGGSAHPATSCADAHKRRPGRELDRWIRVRDRHCIGLLCARPAHSNDLDHTRDWIDQGLTVAGNLGGPCRYCHRRKHDGHWHLHQPRTGHFRWHTLLGARYDLIPRPVIADLPDPAPRPDGRPRPVLDVDPPPDDHDTGWVHDRGRRTTVSADVPTPRPRPTTCPWPDEPTF